MRSVWVWEIERRYTVRDGAHEDKGIIGMSDEGVEPLS